MAVGAEVIGADGGADAGVDDVDGVVGLADVSSHEKRVFSLHKRSI